MRDGVRPKQHRLTENTPTSTLEIMLLHSHNPTVVIVLRLVKAWLSDVWLEKM